VVGINGQWPLPVIEVDKGDRLIVNMYNGLGDKETIDGPSISLVPFWNMPCQ
jgi:FtsP/CotA-like multicopper oxidase with cupredoxin domain